MVSPPGRLTADWIRGRRVGYLAPLSLFLWINVAFFRLNALVSAVFLVVTVAEVVFQGGFRLR